MYGGHEHDDRGEGGGCFSAERESLPASVVEFGRDGLGDLVGLRHRVYLLPEPGDVCGEVVGADVGADLPAAEVFEVVAYPGDLIGGYGSGSWREMFPRRRPDSNIFAAVRIKSYP